MDIRGWLCCLVVSSVFIQCLDAKTISLNDIIAGSNVKPVAAKPPSPKDRTVNSISLNEPIISKTKSEPVAKKTSPPKVPDLSSKAILSNKSKATEITVKTKTAKPSTQTETDLDKRPIPLNKTNTAESQETQATRPFQRLLKEIPKRLPVPKRLPLIKRLQSGKLRNKLISPLKYIKDYKIKSPLQPKKFKLPKLRSKRKNQSKKREVSSKEKLKNKYVPLLKSLSKLLDNLFDSESSKSSEIATKKYKRSKYYTKNRYDDSDSKPSKSSFRITASNLRAKKKATTPSPSVSTETSSYTESVALDTNNDYRTYGQDKDISLLPPRNTSSIRRDDHGSSERSSSTYNGDHQGNITRHSRDYEHNTRTRGNAPSPKRDEEDPYSATRNNTGSIEIGGTRGNGNETRDTTDRKTDGVSSQDESTDDALGKNQHEARGNETESEEFIREPTRRLRGLISKDENIRDERFLSEPLHFEKIHEESVLSATETCASDQRIVDKDGPFPPKGETICGRNETMILIERNFLNGEAFKNDTGKPYPVVMIFDGYSVTRDKNGEKTISGKGFHIQS